MGWTEKEFKKTMDENFSSLMKTVNPHAYKNFKKYKNKKPKHTTWRKL